MHDKTSTVRRVRPFASVSPGVALATLALLGLGCRDEPTPAVPEALEPEVAEVVSDADDPAPPPIPTPAPTADAPEREITDLGITAAVERELLVDDVTPVATIKVETNEGIVELTGTVDNLLAKTRAARIAELVKGVRSVSNRIVVESKEVPNPELTANVESALLFDPVTESYEIEVAASDGRITLEGTVESWAEKQIAEQVAASVRGVEEVENQLEVRSTQARSDAALLTEIQRRLATDVLVDAEQIDVAVDNGAVTLSGIVGSAAERTRAVTRAWTVGVTSVKSDGLEVSVLGRDPNLRKRGFVLESEDEIAAAVNDAMLYDPRVDSVNVRPVVRGTTVTLLGTVENLQAKRAAEQLARNTVGVARVVNELTVQPGKDRAGEQVTDAQTAEAIRARLLTNIYTDAYELQVDVDEGVATLTGTVDTYLEKAEAEDVASRARGVTRIENLIQVKDATIGYYHDPFLDTFEPYVGSWRVYTPAQTALDDSEIAEQIEDQMFWSPFVDEAQVEVSVIDGIATLTGTVDSWREREAASENAYEGGAVDVANLLHVQP